MVNSPFGKIRLLVNIPSVKQTSKWGMCCVRLLMCVCVCSCVFDGMDCIENDKEMEAEMTV